jgi:hypothetical protein
MLALAHMMIGPSKKGHAMDIEEFKKQVSPSAKRSRLEPFRSQILELKSNGYADWQVRDWLAGNGLEVSRQAVQQFFKKIASKPQPTEPQAPKVTAAGEPQTKHESISEVTEHMNVETDRARRERKAQQFIRDEPSNSILKTLNKDRKP